MESGHLTFRTLVKVSCHVDITCCQVDARLGVGALANITTIMELSMPSLYIRCLDTWNILLYGLHLQFLIYIKPTQIKCTSIVMYLGKSSKIKLKRKTSSYSCGIPCHQQECGVKIGNQHFWQIQLLSDTYSHSDIYLFGLNLHVYCTINSVVHTRTILYTILVYKIILLFVSFHIQVRGMFWDLLTLAIQLLGSYLLWCVLWHFHQYLYLTYSH